MKNIIRIGACVCLLALVWGCASPGGYVIGPVSSYTSKSNEKSLVRRAAASSVKLTPAQKNKVFQATASYSDTGEIAATVGVDILELRGSKLSKGELLKQAGGVICDAVIYGGIAAALDGANIVGGGDSSSKSTSRDISVDVSNSQDTTVVIDGDTTTQEQVQN